LRDFLGQLRRADLPQRGGMDEIQMSPDDFVEGILRIFSHELPQQIQITCHFQKYIAAGDRNPTINLMARQLDDKSDGGLTVSHRTSNLLP